MMTHLKILFTTGVILLSLAPVSFAEDTKKDGPASVQETAAAAAPDVQQDEHAHGMPKEKLFVATIGSDGVQRVEVTGGEYFFEPNHIVVKVNVPVELIVKKTGYIPHDIVVKAPQAGIDFAESLSKTPKTIRFVPKTAGKYEMYCSKKIPFVKSHKDKGMDGMIEVVP